MSSKGILQNNKKTRKNKNRRREELIVNKEGATIVNYQDVMEEWTNHFNENFNTEEIINRPERNETRETLGKNRKIIQKLRNNKSARRSQQILPQKLSTKAAKI